jgi:molybdopterin/thiamine biosynthesis adenylyltransferase/rhodanese-related sulfurtransferase
MKVHDIDPETALTLLTSGATLVDIREAHERALGMARDAIGITVEHLSAQLDAHFPDPQSHIVLICQSGRRSQALAERLATRGYDNVVSVSGGMTAWEAYDLPMTRADVDADFSERYARHLRLPEVGLDGQRRLESARVLLLGAGGLGSPAALYMAAAGVGTLRLVDDDVVERSNLQRQILHTDARIGLAKVESAAVALAALNPRTHVEAVAERLSADNVERHLVGVDVVIDGADNFPARYLINDACVHLGIPLVYGAVHRFEGQLSVFDAGRQRGRAPCYRCLFAEPPPPEAAPNCAEAGVLGVLPGIVGILQATEAIKLILGIGVPLAGRLLHIDALATRFRETRLAPDPDCAICAPGRTFPGYIDYAAYCAGG